MQAILFPYVDNENKPALEAIESIREGDYYKIAKIPCYAQDIALGDLVAVKYEGGNLWFDSLAEGSGNSTIQIIFFDLFEDCIAASGEQFVNMGCSWQKSDQPYQIAVNIPCEINYSRVSKFLHKGRKKKRWDYAELALSHSKDSSWSIGMIISINISR
jgi:hypothetical protein